MVHLKDASIDYTKALLRNIRLGWECLQRQTLQIIKNICNYACKKIITLGPVCKLHTFTKSVTYKKKALFHIPILKIKT